MNQIAASNIPPMRADRQAEAWRPETVEAIAVGSSTGGPAALAATFAGWAEHGARPPVFITQHMARAFTGSLAEQISEVSGTEAAEARHGEPITAGRIYLAPGGRHMTVAAGQSGPSIRLNDMPPVHHCRPAVDPLFASLARLYGAGLLAVILTGMGRDGLAGAEAVRKAGGGVVAQDRASSVVWGMPGAVVQAGLANFIIPLNKMGITLATIAGGGAVQ